MVSKEVLLVIKGKDHTMEVGSSVPTFSVPVIPRGIVPSLPELMGIGSVTTVRCDGEGTIPGDPAGDCSLSAGDCSLSVTLDC